MRTLAVEFSQHPFSARFFPCARESISWKKELELVAVSIANEAGSRPITVCSSGGIDSELVCRILYDLGIHFSVLTLEHLAGTNARDISYAKAWCKAHGVEQRIVHLDMPDFFNNGIERYIREGYLAGNVFRYFQLFLLETVESMGGYAVLGGGEQQYHIPDSESSEEKDTYIEFESGFTAPLQWMQKNESSHCPYFFYGTPEATLAYLRIPIVNFAVRNPEMFRHKLNRHIFKRLVCHSVWPDLVSREKLNGYEEIRRLRLETQKELMRRFGEKLETFRLPVERMREQLTANLR